MYINQIYHERESLSRRHCVTICLCTTIVALVLLTLGLILGLVVFKSKDAQDRTTTTSTTLTTVTTAQPETTTTTSIPSTTHQTSASTRFVTPKTTTTLRTTSTTTTASRTTSTSITTTTTTTSTTTTTTTTTSTTTSTTTATSTSTTTTTTTTTTTPDPYTNCKNNFTLIHFDNLPGNASLIPSGYHGLNWTNAGAFNISKYSASGYRTVVTSLPNVAFNGDGKPMSIAALPSANVKSFSVQSFIVAAAWNNNLRLSMTGFRGGATIYNHTIILQTTSKVLLSLDWSNIDRMTFVTSGGVSAGYLQNENGTHVGIDNMCLLTSET